MTAAASSQSVPLHRSWRRALLWAGLFSVVPTLAWASGDAHVDPSAQLALYVALILAAAKLGGHLARRAGQPAVLGELIAGVVLGNVDLLGLTGLDVIQQDPFVDMLARLGVLLLLFQVGLESTVGQMLAVGVSSLLVAVVGVAAPMLLGIGVSALLQPDKSIYVHLFVGATLTATSVGITARVLKDLGHQNTPEARIILGAAVIDDVLGLIILAVVGGVIAAAGAGQPMAALDVLWVIAKASGFLLGALVMGIRTARTVMNLASRLDAEGVLLAFGLGFCFLASWAANAIGLAPIVGAFAAGLVLEEVHFKVFKERGEHGLEELVAPLAQFLVPIFFVIMGMRVDLQSFARPGVLGLAAALTVVAILGKQVCGLAALGKGLRRRVIGFGMIPRGEVGLIFANIGLGLSVGGERVINPETFSALVIMVIVTTMATPPLLAWGLRQPAPGAEPPPPLPPPAAPETP